jgi:hypothetical protein
MKKLLVVAAVAALAVVAAHNDAPKADVLVNPTVTACVASDFVNGGFGDCNIVYRDFTNWVYAGQDI